MWLVGALAAMAALTVVLAILLALRKWPPSQSDSHGHMLLVPAGSFIFGDNSPDSPRPRQNVSLDTFYIDETEVSNAEYRRFVDATGHAAPQSSGYDSHPDDPVSGVTFDDAEAYATWANKQLPTEAEWEKAARGTDGRLYPWGSEPWTTDVPTTLQPVNSFGNRKSPYGMLNMAGNVAEWTATKYPPDDQKRKMADMTASLAKKGITGFSKTWYVFKGGSFSPGGDVFFRSFLRRAWPSDQLSPIIGFRCVRHPSQPGIRARFRALFGR